MAKSKMAKACDISPKVRQEIYNRDNHSCILCNSNIVQVAHYISRARGGLGILENLVCLCPACHADYDNGKHHQEIKLQIELYLKSKYPNWGNINKIYSKWG